MPGPLVPTRINPRVPGADKGLSFRRVVAMSQEKTEEPTPKKLRRARERGEVPKSREVNTAAVLLAAAVGLSWLGPRVLTGLTDALHMSLSAVRDPAPERLTTVLGGVAWTATSAVAPLIGLVMAAGGLAAYLQVGALFSVQPILPQPTRLDPVKGLGRLFSQRQVVELLKTLAKMAIVGAVAWATLREGLRGVVGVSAVGPGGMLRAGGALVSALLLRVGATMAAVALLDGLYQRWRHRRDQRMTKDELKREHRDSEGDPHAKQHRERMHREIVEHAVLEEVRRADVLVVNPTHLAVALRYDETEHEAPEVRAKGQDALARRMIEAARQSGVPVMRDVPLARALYELDLGDEIPPALYEAVAAVLRAAWREREDDGDGRAVR
jgi:flagellar biosynthesis protein FlhB